MNLTIDPPHTELSLGLIVRAIVPKGRGQAQVRALRLEKDGAGF